MSGSVSHLSFLQIVLQQVAAVVHRLCRLDLEAYPVRQLVYLPENLFEFFAAQQIAQLPASHRDEEEHVPHDDVELFEERAETVQILCIVPADRRVYLD